jgi:hypothetical protein
MEGKDEHHDNGLAHDDAIHAGARRMLHLGVSEVAFVSVSSFVMCELLGRLLSWTNP